jgi:N-acetylneuraminic acid mutarotase
MALAVLDGKVYGAGGLPGERENDFAVYDPERDVWTSLPPMPTPRNHATAVALNGKIYVIGGFTGATLAMLPTVEEYDPGTSTWTERAAMPSARASIASVAGNGAIYVLGGEINPSRSSGIFSQIEAYDPATDSWRHVGTMAAPRHGIQAATIGNRVYIPGGAMKPHHGPTGIFHALELPDF